MENLSDLAVGDVCIYREGYFMSKFYVIDTTIRKNGQNPVMVYDTIPEVVKQLEDMCQRYHKISRKTYMQNCESLGFGLDDPAGRNFYEQMEQYFNIGVIRKDSRPVKCNIFEAEFSRDNKEAYGN
jgi:hypothetical protein